MATANFYQDLILSTTAAKDQDHPPVTIVSDPAIPDRTEYLLGRGPDPKPRLLAAAKSLSSAGVGLVAMPCNTATTFIPFLEAGSGLRFINWVESVVEDVADHDVSVVGIWPQPGPFRSASTRRR